MVVIVFDSAVIMYNTRLFPHPKKNIKIARVVCSTSAWADSMYK
jgi:hypothetical protein